MCPQTINGIVLTAKADLQLLFHKVPNSLPDFKDATVSPLSPP